MKLNDFVEDLLEPLIVRKLCTLLQASLLGLVLIKGRFQLIEWIRAKSEPHTLQEPSREIMSRGSILRQSAQKFSEGVYNISKIKISNQITTMRQEHML